MKFNFCLCCCTYTKNQFIEMFLIFDIIINLLLIIGFISDTIRFGSNFVGGLVVYILFFSLSLFIFLRFRKDKNSKDSFLNCYSIFKLVIAIIYIIALCGFILAIITINTLNINLNVNLDYFKFGVNVFLAIIFIPISLLVIWVTHLYISFYKAVKFQEGEEGTSEPNDEVIEEDKINLVNKEKVE